MQGTQYAPRESILCMEHFVALQCIIYTCTSTCDVVNCRILVGYQHTRQGQIQGFWKEGSYV